MTSRKFYVGDNVQLSYIASNIYDSQGRTISKDSVGRIVQGFRHHNDEKCVVEFDDGKLVLLRAAVLVPYSAPVKGDFVEIKNNMSVNGVGFQRLTRGRIVSDHHELSDSYIVRIITESGDRYLLVPRKELNVLVESDCRGES